MWNYKSVMQLLDKARFFLRKKAWLLDKKNHIIFDN